MSGAVFLLVSWHGTTRAYALLVVVVTAMAALIVLPLFFAEVVSFILWYLHLMIRTSPSVTCATTTPPISKRTAFVQAAK